MKPVDYDTYELALAATTPITWKTINSNEAEQFFQLTGSYDALDLNKDNTTVLELIAGAPTTVGNAIRAMLRTMSKSGGKFSTDPNKQDGQLNRAAGTAIVAAGILPQTIIDMFFELGKVGGEPAFPKLTLEQYNLAKAEQAAQGTTAATTVKHDGIVDLDGTGKMVNNRARRFKAVALLDAVTTFDTTITITLEEATADGVTKVEHPDKITIPVKAGSQPVIKFFPSVYTRWFRVKSATIGLIDTPFSLEIDGVQ